jgi:hypothetical protein
MLDSAAKSAAQEERQLTMRQRRGIPGGSILGLVAALLLFSLPAGCGNTYNLYEGPERSRDEIAVVSTIGTRAYPFWAEKAHIRKVDGKNVVPVDRVPASTVKLAPGHYTFEIAHSRGVGLGCASPERHTGLIAFNIEAGREYRIAGKSHFIWAVDSQTGQVVAGLKPE